METIGLACRQHPSASKLLLHTITLPMPPALVNPAIPRTHVQRRDAKAGVREALLRAGLDAVLEGGWAATSIDKVLSTVGVPKGSFYHYFASKNDFGQALLERYQAMFLKRLHRCFGERPEAPAPSFTHQLAAFLSESTASMRRFAWRRGSLIGVLGQELGSLDDAFRKRLDACITEWEDVLAEAIRRAQARGDIPARAEPERLACSFWAAWEGAVLRARLARSAAPLVKAVEDLDRLVKR